MQLHLSAERTVPRPTGELISLDLSAHNASAEAGMSDAGARIARVFSSDSTLETTHRPSTRSRNEWPGAQF